MACWRVGVLACWRVGVGLSWLRSCCCCCCCCSDRVGSDRIGSALVGLVSPCVSFVSALSGLLRPSRPGSVVFGSGYVGYARGTPSGGVVSHVRVCLWTMAVVVGALVCVVVCRACRCVGAWMSCVAWHECCVCCCGVCCGVCVCCVCCVCCGVCGGGGRKGRLCVSCARQFARVV